MFWRKVHGLTFVVCALGAWSGIARAQGCVSTGTRFFFMGGVEM
jgi:hypothetical protein